MIFIALRAIKELLSDLKSEFKEDDKKHKKRK
jgi:hypothetical protein